MRTVKPHANPVISIAVDQTGSVLATGAADGTVKVWDIRGGYVSHTFRAHAGIVSALRFFELPSGIYSPQSVVKGKSKSNKRKQTFDESTADKRTRSETGSTSVLCLASGGDDSKVRIWDLEKRDAIALLDSHVSVVRALDFSKEQGLLLSGSRDKTVITWDVKTWEIKYTVPILESVEAAGFLSAGKYIYVGGEHGRLRIWNYESRREITPDQPLASEGKAITDIAPSHGGQSLLCIRADQTLDFYSTSVVDQNTSTTLIEPLPILQRISGTHDEVIDLAYVGPDRKWMALATNLETIRLVSVEDIDGGSDSASYFGADVGELQAHHDIVICLDADWSGSWLATGAKDKTARIWHIDALNASSSKPVETFTGHADSVGALAFSSHFPASGSAAYKNPSEHPPDFLITGSQDKTIKLWKVAKRSNLRQHSGAEYTRKAHDKDINALAVNHSNTLFASASQDRTVKIWSLRDGETKGILKGHRRGVWTVQFAPKGTPSLSGDFGGASSSSGLILTGSGDKTVKVWSLSDFSCIRTLEGHTNTVLKALWLPQVQQDDASLKSQTQESPLIISAGSDGLVKVWDASEGECACTLDNHTDRVWALATNTSTNHLVSGGGDGVVTFWANTTASMAAANEAASIMRTEQEQELSNHAHRGNYREAIVLSLQLNHPARLLTLFQDVVEKSPQEDGSLSGLEAVDKVLAALDDEQLFTLLLRLRDWNTNARSARIAQKILWVIAKTYPASRLVNLRKRGKGLRDVLEALKVYTERHFQRCEELLEESYVVDFIVRGMENQGFIEDGNRSNAIIEIR